MKNIIQKLVKKLLATSATQLTAQLVALLLIQPLHALEFECSNGGDKRFIRLELPGLTHLCEVSVTKTDNARDVKWYANHDTMFCTEKALELADKYQQQWGFQCEQWPDHDGVDQLNARQRTILDAELKFLIELGKSQSTPYLVEGVKVAASPTSADQSNMLVAQFFLSDIDSDITRDVTHIIRDDGVSWNTLSKIETLADYVEANEGYIVNSALISTVTDNGAMEVITVLDAANTEDNNDGCYGNQMLTADNNGKLIPRSPHRFICAEKLTGDAG